MAKPKFTLNPSPTFKAVVSIPVPGGKGADIEWTFRHRTRDQFKDLMNSIESLEDVELLLEIASGWDLEDAFDADNLETMTQNYPGSARAVFVKYIDEMTAARTKN
jgi:hypothetical protein